MKAKNNARPTRSVKPLVNPVLPNFDVLPNSALLRERWLLQGLVPFSSATLWRRVKAGTFPAPIKLEGRITVWTVGSVRRWLEIQSEETK